MTTENILAFGENVNDLARVLGITGEEIDSIKTFSIEENELYAKILIELKKFNLHLSLITKNTVSSIEAEGYKKVL